MTQALQRELVTFEEFIAKYPDNSNKRYELHDGVVIEMPPPTGDHEEIILFLIEKFILEYTRLKLSYGCPKTALVKPSENESAYLPDVLLLNRPNLVNEPLWKKESTLTALPAAMRYILKAESYDSQGAKGKLYCIIAGSAVFKQSQSLWSLRS